MPKKQFPSAFFSCKLCILELFEVLTEGGGKLVGAGGRLKTATDSAKTLDCLLNAHTLDECGDALGVA